MSDLTQAALDVAAADVGRADQLNWGETANANRIYHRAQLEVRPD
jgi:hypothetical protein